MSTVSDVQKSQCCGCGACMSICPSKAIKMIADDKGFLYPNIEDKKCIKCGICYKVCESARTISKDVKAAFAVKNKDDNIRNRSSSGGVSYALCRAMIEKGGVCYGVAYDEQFKVITKRATNLVECDLFFGSKYVAVDTNDTFLRISEDLTKGLPVLYFGTSCHVSGLMSFLAQKHIDIEQLVTVDLICHGVPSPLLFQDFVDLLGRDKLEKFDFRTKELDWGESDWNFGCLATYKNSKRVLNSPKVRSYYTIFSHNYSLRDHCFNCEYASPNKPADITIADYWGLKYAHPELMDPKGVSAILVHSDKGLSLISDLNDCEIYPTTVELIRKKQFNLNSPSKPNPKENEFWALYRKKGYLGVARKYGDYTVHNNIRYFLWKTGMLNILKKVIRRG